MEEKLRVAIDVCGLGLQNGDIDLAYACRRILEFPDITTKADVYCDKIFPYFHNMYLLGKGKRNGQDEIIRSQSVRVV